MFEMSSEISGDRMRRVDERDQGTRNVVSVNDNENGKLSRERSSRSGGDNVKDRKGRSRSYSRSRSRSDRRSRKRDSRSRDRYRRRRSRERDERRSRSTSLEKRSRRTNDKDYEKESRVDRHGSRSRGRDHSRSPSKDRKKREPTKSRSRSRSNKKAKKRSKSKRSRSESADSESDHDADSEDGLTEDQKIHKRELEKLTRDARTVFVSQLQVKVTEKDMKKFFQAVCDVKDVVLIRDRFTNRSKGFGYVEVKTLEDVPKALMLTGQRFIFRNGKQGFPISVKASEAEKNFTHQLEKRVATMSRAPTSAQLSAGGPAPKSRDTRRDRDLPDDEWDDRLVITNVHPNIEESQLRELCASFGALKKLELAQDREGKRNGSANVYFEQAIDAMKALKELNGLDLAGLKLGVSRMRKTPSERARERQSARRDDDDRKENMDSRAWRLEDDEIDVGRIGGGGVSMNSHTRASLMSKLGGGLGEELLQQAIPVTKEPEKKDLGPGRIQGVASRYLVIKNMFDPRSETEPDWEQAIEEDTKLECENFGTVLHCAVDNQSAGHVYVMFDTIQAGVDSSHALHGRWFAKRMVQVEYLKQETYEFRFPEVRRL